MRVQTAASQCVCVIREHDALESTSDWPVHTLTFTRQTEPCLVEVSSPLETLAMMLAVAVEVDTLDDEPRDLYVGGIVVLLLPSLY